MTNNLETELRVRDAFAHLNPVERQNIAFSRQIHHRLRGELPNIHDIPFVYVGSGGDLLSAWFVSGSRSIFLIDDNAFVDKGMLEENVSDTAENLWRKIEDGKKNMIGVLTLWMNVEPGIKIFRDSQRIGLTSDAIHAHRIEQNNAHLTAHLPDVFGALHPVEVFYIRKNIEGIEDMRGIISMTRDYSDIYGLLVKGGAGRSLPALMRQFRMDGKVEPRYIVADDPRFSQTRAITHIEEAALFPGFRLQEITHQDRLLWGYSWDTSTDTLGSNESWEYRTRAVIGVRDDG